ncbi:hypothetical protein [Stutzerimonas tarimensis]|uniref:Uncharacterized protein n=1 Tax=Stutzerimonas tarimensis TaxID=1507735 RepID=A0ABV7T821_9GAMM
MQVLLPLSVLLVLLGLITRAPLLGVTGGALMVAFFVRYWSSLMPYPRRLGVVTLATTLWWLLQGGSGAELQRALGSAAYYGTFIGALGLMHAVVKRLPQVSGLHRILLAGPSRWLYPSYLFSAFAISSVLSFGMLNLVCSSLQHHLDRQSYTDAQRRGGQRGVMVTALRGFALVPLIAPTSVTVAILSRELPGLTWSALLPYGLLCALVLLVLGWPAETARLSLLGHTDTPEEGPRREPMIPLLLTCLAALALIAGLASFSWLSATQAAMVLIPVGVVAFLFRTLPTTAVGREVTDTLAGMRNEIFIFAASGLLGGLVAALVPVGELAPLFSSTPLGPFILGSIAMVSIIVLALAGVAPIITLNLCAGLLVPLADRGVPIMQPAVALLAGFSLAMLLSPYGPSALMLSRYAQISPWNIAFRWNGRFALLAIVPLLAIAWIA